MWYARNTAIPPMVLMNSLNEAEEKTRRRVGVKCNRVIVLLASCVLLVGLGAPAFAGVPEPDCELVIEVNALRGGSPTVTSQDTKDITAKARLVKGANPADAQLLDTTLTIQTRVGTNPTDTELSPESLTLIVGRGGQGDKLRMDVPQCETGEIINFVATFEGTASTNGATCSHTSDQLNKTCK